MLAGQLLTATILFAIAALALHFDQLLARRFWAEALVTHSGTFVATQLTRLGAALAAQLARLLAVAFMAGPYALMSPAGQGLSTSEPTAKTGLGARYGLALFMIAMTPFRGEHHAWRAGGRGMTIVLRCVLAAMGTRTGTLADGFLGAAGHGRIDNLSSALTVQFLEAAAVARRTIAPMAGLIAFMTPAG